MINDRDGFIVPVRIAATRYFVTGRRCVTVGAGDRLDESTRPPLVFWKMRSWCVDAAQRDKIAAAFLLENRIPLNYWSEVVARILHPTKQRHGRCNKPPFGRSRCACVSLPDRCDATSKPECGKQSGNRKVENFLTLTIIMY